MRQRVENAFHQFIDVHFDSDEDIAKAARALHLDIAIDLGGHTKGNRIGIFAYRVAPVQISYIGYLGTLGANYFDYLIADKTIIPREFEQFYQEKIIYLPSYQVNDTKKKPSDHQFSRKQLGLPEDGFVFCCFNNIYKIQPGTFDSWMRILKKVNHSVLFLYADNTWAQSNLKKEAQTRGIDPTRLIFGGRMHREDYLARFKACNLFLDTSPYNAGTTASDALWVGLPVLTCLGKSFPSRMAASLLNALEINELIADTPEAYESKAIELATHPEMLESIRKKIEFNKSRKALFNTKQFAKYLESAFEEIHNRQQNQLPLESIFIPTQHP